MLHQPCYAVIEGVQIVGPRMMLPISNVTSAAFFIAYFTIVKYTIMLLYLCLLSGTYEHSLRLLRHYVIFFKVNYPPKCIP